MFHVYVHYTLNSMRNVKHGIKTSMLLIKLSICCVKSIRHELKVFCFLLVGFFFQ